LTLSHLRILICGDIEEEGIRQLMRWGKERLKSEVVILPHHGKYVSNIAELLSLCEGEMAVISCGENSYGHPSPETIELLTDLKIPYFITQEDGAICFRPTRKNWEVKKFGKGRV
jgi:competence protein ComEC